MSFREYGTSGRVSRFYDPITLMVTKMVMDGEEVYVMNAPTIAETEQRFRRMVRNLRKARVVVRKGKLRKVAVRPWHRKKRGR